ncbi:Ammonium transporter [Granulibacter bethesdensis]|uniref:Ammonium transporter n=2 Tax=Granulibacter bethesdensis TaxID=364410 RepID=Q0BQ69_GRABC|nr:Ammonium transporter [Granulibacter bethesdensis CGDNIH1]AHJ68004.1 Ammonium transporter [Granulibacter bethesdensis]APH52905.1 Ammonium transporter [Granulibacter bethesdensis]APH65593.1 Ammonium transporter [Granulibacter bethesdensis]
MCFIGGHQRMKADLPCPENCRAQARLPSRKMGSRKLGLGAAAAALPLFAAMPAWADTPKIDSGDTAWMLISSVIVLMMTVPGLGLFYAGMVRKKNILATMMQAFSAAAVLSIVWMVAGYSLAFGTGNAYVGDMSRFLLNGIADHIVKGSDAPMAGMTIPESLFMFFQMTFAIITPALIAGAFADRMKFSAYLVFIVLWSLIVYSPVAHWVWASNGWLAGMGAADFAGGTVVHINAGVAGLVCALVLGKRYGYGRDDMSPHDLSYALIGASLLWVGWFGFNAGSAGSAGGRAAMAAVATQLGAAGAAIGWIVVEWMVRGKPTVLGALSGAVAGLVAITPAAGFVLPGPAVLIGLIAGAICFWGATSLKHMLGYDDSLDAWGVHGIGGITGALLTGIFAYGPLSATDASPAGVVGGIPQLIIQAKAVGITLVWSGVMTFILLKIIDVVIGLRVTQEEEVEGLDVTLHGERLG